MGWVSGASLFFGVVCELLLCTVHLKVGDGGGRDRIRTCGIFGIAASCGARLNVRFQLHFVHRCAKFSSQFPPLAAVREFAQTKRLLWVQRMNAIREAAMEIVNHNIVHN